MRLAYAALAVLALSFAPLLIVAALDPSSNPVGLGLLSVAGTFAAAVLLACAAVRGLWRLLAGRGRS